VVGRDPLNLAQDRDKCRAVVNAVELLEGKSSGSVLETENTAVGILHVVHVALSIRKSWHYLHRQAAVTRSE
jgi:hypothetical protein